MSTLGDNFSLPTHPALTDHFKRSHVRGIVDLLAKTFPEADVSKWTVRVDKARSLYDIVIHAPLDRYHSVLMTMPDGNQNGSTNAILAKLLLGNAFTGRLMPSKRIENYCDMNLDNDVWSDFIGWVSMTKAKYEEVRFPRRFTVMATFIGAQTRPPAQWGNFTVATEIDLFPWPDRIFIRVYLASEADKPFNLKDAGWHWVWAKKENPDVIQGGWVIPAGGWADHHLIPEMWKG